jgi:hypothetical protein
MTSLRINSFFFGCRHVRLSENTQDWQDREDGKMTFAAASPSLVFNPVTMHKFLWIPPEEARGTEEARETCSQLKKGCQPVTLRPWKKQLSGENECPTIHPQRIYLLNESRSKSDGQKKKNRQGDVRPETSSCNSNSSSSSQRLRHKAFTAH